MFSGITETLGIIQHIQHENDCTHLTIQHHGLFNDINIGDSIAVNGTCLTVTSFDANTFSVTAVPETLRLTNLGLLKNNDAVNLERAIRANQRIGGHYVQGHIDTLATIKSIQPDGKGAIIVDFMLDKQWQRYLIHKGYIAIDGMSLTVMETHDQGFKVTFIPHTQTVTVVQHYSLRHRVNIEVDMMSKTIEKLLMKEVAV